MIFRRQPLDQIVASLKQLGRRRPRMMDLPEAIERVRPSVVQIRLHDAILGTGFFVDQLAHVITAKHVVDAGRKLAQQSGVAPEFAAGMATPNMQNASFPGATNLTITQSFNIVGADIVAEDPINDLALLRLRANPFAGELPVLIRIGDTEITGLHAVSTPDVERPADGLSLAASGYPLQNQALVTNSGSIASGWLSDRDAAALLQQQNPWSHGSADRYLADLEVNGGNSGGPIYRTDDARVIGVCVATQSAPVMFGDQEGGPVVADDRPLVYSSGLTVVVPAKYVVALLEQEGLAWGATLG